MKLGTTNRICTLVLLIFAWSVRAGTTDARAPGEPPPMTSASTAKRGWNSPYVTSGVDGRIYAKGVPSDRDGTKGTTKIYRVRQDADELLDTYDWYAPCHYSDGVVLGWSPIVGKVAVMRIHNEPVDVADGRIELSFYIGGKFLKAYAVKDLLALGVKQKPQQIKTEGSRDFLSYKVLGCVQVPNTNEYRFSIEVSDGKKIMFDILTGGVVAEARAK